MADDMRTRLIEETGDKQALTLFRDCDCRTAMARGLAEYMGQLSIDTEDGRHLALRAVLHTTAETEDDAVYPSAEVYLPTEGTYDPTGFTPSLAAEDMVAPGIYLAQPNDFTAELRVEVWTTEIEDRVALQIMLEDATTPVTWMSGFRLELPHYFNARADYILLRAQFVEDEDKNSQRYRIAVLIVKATMPQLRPFGLPLARPATRVTVSEDAVPDTMQGGLEKGGSV